MAKTTAFDQPCAQRGLEARQAPLRELLPELAQELELHTALDAGCGVGYFSTFLKKAGLDVIGFDGRKENVEEAQQRFPQVKFFVANVEDSSIVELGCFDLVLCFGLLYHLENPFRAIRNLCALTRKVLLIESMCIPAGRPLMYLLDEPRIEDQGLSPVAFYPSEQCLIKMCYQAGFRWVYRLTNLPNHEDFRTSLWRKRRRTMLAASKLPLRVARLQPVGEPSGPRDPWAPGRDALRQFFGRLGRYLFKPWREKLRSIGCGWLLA